MQQPAGSRRSHPDRHGPRVDEPPEKQSCRSRLPSARRPPLNGLVRTLTDYRPGRHQQKARRRNVSRMRDAPAAPADGDFWLTLERTRVSPPRPNRRANRHRQESSSGRSPGMLCRRQVMGTGRGCFCLVKGPQPTCASCPVGDAAGRGRLRRHVRQPCSEAGSPAAQQGRTGASAEDRHQRPASQCTHERGSEWRSRRSNQAADSGHTVPRPSAQTIGQGSGEPPFQAWSRRMR